MCEIVVLARNGQGPSQSNDPTAEWDPLSRLLRRVSQSCVTHLSGFCVEVWDPELGDIYDYPYIVVPGLFEPLPDTCCRLPETFTRFISQSWVVPDHLVESFHF